MADGYLKLEDRINRPVYAVQDDSYHVPADTLTDWSVLMMGIRQVAGDLDVATVIDTLGLTPDSPLVRHVDFPDARRVPAAIAQLLPRVRRDDHVSAYPVEIVRSYGRGYVQPDLSIAYKGVPMTGGIAVKGTGPEGWAADNAVWIRRENRQKDFAVGKFPDWNFVRDLVGEVWARIAGLTAPVTIAVGGPAGSYRNTRFWRSPYRLWELTSGPFRGGRSVSQALVLLHWDVELQFALRFRETIAARARSCLSQVSTGPLPTYLGGLEQTLLANLVALAAQDIQCGHYTFHLANIAYSGETSGFERLQGRTSDIQPFRLGLVTALVETWAGVAWIGAVLGMPFRSFQTYFDAFRSQLAASAASSGTVDFFAEGDRIEDVLAGLESTKLAFALRALFFHVRQENDVVGFIAACETFFTGLALVFAGEIADFASLKRWQEQVDFAACEAQRLVQAYGGHIDGRNRAKYDAYVDEYRAVTAEFPARCGFA